MEVTEFFSLEMLATPVGAALITWVFISFLAKVFGKLWSDTANSICIYFIALGLLVMGNILAETTWPFYVLSIFNAAVIYGAVVQLGKKDIPTLMKQFKKE